MKDKKFGTFSGVFTPTILTIVGLVMYLRLGWVISQVGLKWTLIIILLCHVVTITAALSLSSIATNIVLGHGGFYYVISRSLGLEAGGAVGIPLYISQALGAAFYLLGFTETVLSVFPHSNPVLIKGGAFCLLLIVSILGAGLAMKIQFLIMSVMIASIISFILGVFQDIHVENIVNFWNVDNQNSVGFWYVLAIFFPAVTGIDCGVAMSGDLKDPSKSIPKGVMYAVFVGIFFYLVIAFFYVMGVDGDISLLEDSMFMTKKAKWSWLVVCGIMGATLSSALGTILGAPRVLYALSVDRLVPFGRLLSWRTKGGEPIGAIFFSACIMSTVLFLIDLDKVAQVLTMFFIITYGAANACVFLEKLVNSPSFRPVFQIPIIVPLIGTIWCLFLMFCIDYFFAIVSILCVLLVYILELRRNINREWGDVRYGLLSWVAEWSLKTASRMPQGRRNWRPNFFVPVNNLDTYGENIEFIKDLAWPRGTVRGFLFQKNHEICQDEGKLDGLSTVSTSVETVNGEMKKKLEDLFLPLSSRGIYTTSNMIHTREVIPGYEVALQVLQGMSFTPNLGFFSLPSSSEEDAFISELIQLGIKNKLGMVILLANSKKKFGKKEKINVWIRSSSAPNLSLTVLIAVLLSKNWSCSVNLVSVVSEISEKSIKESSLESIIKRGRLPRDTITTVLVGKFPEFSQQEIPFADLNIFGTVTNEAKLGYARELFGICNTSCLFIKDSGQESMTV